MEMRQRGDDGVAGWEPIPNRDVLPGPDATTVAEINSAAEVSVIGEQLAPGLVSSSLVNLDFFIASSPCHARTRKHLTPVPNSCEKSG